MADVGILDIEYAKKLSDGDTAIIALVHVSNVIGGINPIETLAELVHDHDGYVHVDGG